MSVIYGTHFDDNNDNTIFGTAESDTIFLLEGDDWAKGSEGSDTLLGGSGLDVLMYDDLAAGIVINAAATNVRFNGETILSNTVKKDGSVDVIDSFEAFHGTRHGDRFYYSQTEYIFGEAGDDVFRVVDAANRTEGVNILPGNGNDIVYGHYLDTVSYNEFRWGYEENLIGKGITLIFTDSNLARIYDRDGSIDTTQDIFNFTGSNNGDLMYADSEAVSFDGAAGNDYLKGGASDDHLFGGDGNDRLDGGESDDALSGNEGNDRFWGRTGNDTLYGDGGADVLAGGAGLDSLTGGTGQDRFAFGSTGESGARTASADVIADFVAGQDKIDLAALDAFADTRVNDAFVWRGEDAFSSATRGEVRFQAVDNLGTDNDFTMVWIDTDADLAVEMAIRLTGLHDLSATDFVL